MAFRTALRALPPWAVLIAAEALLLLYAHPGLMTQDSYDHLVEVRTDFVTDSHPPAMVALWNIVDAIVAGQVGMLVLQSVALVTGLYWVFQRMGFAPRAAAWATFGVFVYPPVMLPMAVVWKDCVMAGALMLGAAGLLAERRWVRVTGLVACGVATAMRYNAFGATLPLIVLLFEWRPGMRWLARYALATAAWLAVTAAAFVANAALTDRQMHFWQSSLAVMDIVGTLAHVDEELSDAELRETFRGTELQIDAGIHAAMRERYSPRNFSQIVTGERPLWKLPIWGLDPAPAPQRDAVTRAWKSVVFEYPLEYAQYRLATMAEVVSLWSSRPSGAVTRRDSAPDRSRELGLATGWSPLQAAWTRQMLRLWRALPIFVPWVYIVVALILLVAARKQRDLVALLASGLVFESSLLFLAPSPDYRYSHWMVTCTCVAIVVMTARRYRARGDAAHSNPPLVA